MLSMGKSTKNGHGNTFPEGKLQKMVFSWDPVMYNRGGSKQQREWDSPRFLLEPNRHFGKNQMVGLLYSHTRTSFFLFKVIFLLVDTEWGYFSQTCNMNQRTFLDLAPQMGTGAPQYIYIYICTLYEYIRICVCMCVYVCSRMYLYINDSKHM